jgi:hypothetical protein
MSRIFKQTDEVAVMPPGRSDPNYVKRITRVSHAGHCLVRTFDGETYTANEGVDLGGSGCRIVPANQEHKTALLSKSKQRPAKPPLTIMLNRLFWWLGMAE